MPEYRAYIIGDDGHFYQAFPVFGADDDEAKEKATQLVNRGHDVELWQLDRKVDTSIPQAKKPALIEPLPGST